MVSELSARLMRGHNYNAPTSAYQTKKIFADLAGCRSSAVVSPNGSQPDEPMTSITACTEKLHQISQGGRRKVNPHNAQQDQGCFKRRKIDELSFAASHVKEDLAKSGLPFPSLDASLSHHIDLGEKATKQAVKRVCAKSVASSPFLTNAVGPSCSKAATMIDFGNLFAATFDSYGTTKNHSGTTVVSSGSSICSDNKSNISSDGDSIVIPARLEDALLQKTQRAACKVTTPEEDTAASVATDSQRRAIYANPITIREAFENSNEARLVTLSFAPFLVVHANPAYTEKTGLSPADILGKPFHEVIQDKVLKATTAKASALTSLHEQVTSLNQYHKATADSMDARIKVAVVGPENQKGNMDRSYFSHYMVALVEEQPEAPAVTDDDSADSSSGEEASLQDSDMAMLESAMDSDDDEDDVIDALEIPPLPPILEASIPAMRLHCGVMG
ncbi:expressed unknown protein [Seminavis robusta]|uniref:PAS domain-containing protein n=1 Tax=Seminavis robusta TaxID=568900 RepID=A0A9N8EQS8_9STRA|nr:expressed unknown protein [Seminavis robusta]|eukprot:Sro1363_g266350.1 n/a (446) ;mRNA; r:12193-13619